MSEINRHSAGSKQAGVSMGGKFAATEKTVATGQGLTPPAGYTPALGDSTTREERDAAVNFTARDAEIRALWNRDTGIREAEAQASELSAALVRDTLRWRYPEADHVIIAEHNGEDRELGEVRAADSSVIAYDAVIGEYDDHRDYSRASQVNVADSELLDDLWAHVGALPRIGENAPHKTTGDLTKYGVDLYRLDLDPASSNHRRLTEAYDVQDSDWEEAAEVLARDLQYEDEFYGCKHEDIVKEIIDNGRRFHPELAKRIPDIVNRNAIVRAYDAGVHHPLDERFEQDWCDTTINELNGRPLNSRSGAAQRERLEEVLSMRAELEAGRLKPKDIVGTGYRRTKTVAREYLDQRERAAHEAIRTRGRSLVQESWFSAGELARARDEALGLASE
ncbi:hypothetical protein ACXR2T_09980 [Leucobacter sp. HY1910]